MKIITAIKSWLFWEKHSANHWRKNISVRPPCSDVEIQRHLPGGWDWCGPQWVAGGFVARQVGRICAPRGPDVCSLPLSDPWAYVLPWLHLADSQWGSPATKHQAPPGLAPMQGQLLKGCDVPRDCSLWWMLSTVASGMAWWGRELGDTHWY